MHRMHPLSVFVSEKDKIKGSALSFFHANRYPVAFRKDPAGSFCGFIEGDTHKTPAASSPLKAERICPLRYALTRRF